ncbi:MAG: AAA family ATPase [Terriglobales bacterium]
MAIARVTKSLGPQGPERQEGIEFEKTEQVVNPVPLHDLQKNPALKNSEPLISNQGSLFALTAEEFTVIRSLIDDLNPIKRDHVLPYNKKNALETLFLSETELEQMLVALKEKKNVILQGAPGVGKTFAARILAYCLIGAADTSRVQMVQFHQSYSYEDFIQGYRPSEGGHFELKNGHFFQFCRKAQRDPEKRPYVFIIDEINRGNLAKILGEVMMLIEPDKRGPDFAIALAYSGSSDETFFVPENVYVIGLMNTADRSLAMVDYALRRRFRFVTLMPQFDSPRFAKHLTHHGASPTLIKKIVDRMTALNAEIATDEKNLGPGYRIGHSFFCPLNATKIDENWYTSIVRSEVRPLLEEYWLDDEDRVKAHVAMLTD